MWDLTGTSSPIESHSRLTSSLRLDSTWVRLHFGCTVSHPCRIQIDWEYPDSQAEQQALVDLLRLCREELDGLASKKGKPGHHYELSVCPVSHRREGALVAPLSPLNQIAAPCGAHVYEKLLVPEIDRYLDFWNLMVCRFQVPRDYPLMVYILGIRRKPTVQVSGHPSKAHHLPQLSGSWSSAADHQAALYASGPQSPCIDTAVGFYRSRGVPSHKIILGTSCDPRLACC